MLTHQILIEQNPQQVTVNTYDEAGALIISKLLAGELAGKAIIDAVQAAASITAAEKVAGGINHGNL